MGSFKTREKYCEMEENSGAMAAVSKQATPCDFNGLLEMNLPHIVERIFLFLDHESFVSCCEVSRIWNSILTAEPINKKAKSLFREEIVADEKQLSRLSRYGGKATDVRRILLSGLVNVNVKYMWGTWGTMTPIYSAASDGRINIVQMLLDTKADPNLGAKTEMKNESPLHAAVHNNYFGIAKLLLERGAVFNKGESPLCWLHKTCPEKMAKLLIQNGADVNQRDEEGNTPLGRAARHARADIMKLLLDAGAEPEKTEICLGVDSGSTPLFTAAGWANKAAIKLLVERGADPNRQELEMEDTPLQYAIIECNYDTIKPLLKAGADPNLANKEGETPLHPAARSGQTYSVKLLINSGADPKTIDKKGKTPLCYAREEGHREIIRYMTREEKGKTLPVIVTGKENGESCLFNLIFQRNVPHILEMIFLSLDHESFVSCCEVNTTWNKFLNSHSINEKAKYLFKEEIVADQKQLYHLTRYGGQASDVRTILRSGLVNVNISQKLGSWGTETPLYSAANDGRINIVRMLLDAKADPNKGAEPSRMISQSPLRVAVANNHFSVAKLLLERGAVLNNGGSPLCWLHKTCLYMMAKLLIHYGADVNKRDEEGNTPLGRASLHARADIMRLLLDAGAEPEKTEICLGVDYGSGPLFTAAGWANKAAIKLLVERGADPNRQELEMGNTPLHYAISECNYDTINPLLKAGADPNLANKRGETSLHDAAKLGQTYSVELLMNGGADTKKVDKKGKTALCYASEEGHRDIIKLLTR